MTDTHTIAHIPDEAVQAALDVCDKVDWVPALAGTGLCGREVVVSALTAAYPHLSAPCAVEAKKLPCDVQLPGAIFKRGVSISTLIAALERREHWPYEDTHLPAKPVDVAAVRRQAFEEILAIADVKEKYFQQKSVATPDLKERSDYCHMALALSEFSTAIRALSAEPAQGDHIADVGKMVEALKETRIDLVVLSGNIADAEKSSYKWEGMYDRVRSWIDRIDAALPAAPTTEAGE